MTGVIIRQLGRREYAPIWHAMKGFTESRTPETADEFWLLEHDPVFTQGQAGKAEHLLAPGNIPVVAVDRGGQVTYHGPGQLMVYTLIDIARLGLGVRELVDRLEQALVQTLATLDIDAHPRRDAPGVYVGEEKIASLGLRIRRGCAYHGLALNLDMDLSPFQRINPCGFAGMPVTDVKRLRPEVDLNAVRRELLSQLCRSFEYSQMDEQPPELPGTAQSD